MRPSPPRHLAQRRSRLDLARNRHLVLQSSSLLAVVLLVTVILANLPGGGPGSGAASGGPSGVTAGEPTPTATAGFGNPVRNWSFEQDLDGWQVIGAGDASAAPQGRTSGSCASVRARGPQPQRLGLAMPGVVEATRGNRFVASAWVRSTAAGLRVTVRLVGTGEQAEGSRASATTLPGLRWRRVIVDHTTAARTDLAVEITAEAVPPGDALLVDEVMVRQG
jgi:hypothetical protein